MVPPRLSLVLPLAWQPWQELEVLIVAIDPVAIPVVGGVLGASQEEAGVVDSAVLPPCATLPPIADVLMVEAGLPPADGLLATETPPEDCTMVVAGVPPAEIVMPPAAATGTPVVPLVAPGATYA